MGCMGMYVCVWVCMGMYVCVWVCMGMYGMYGYVCLCMGCMGMYGMYGYVWVCMFVFAYECLFICINMVSIYLYMYKYDYIHIYVPYTHINTCTYRLLIQLIFNKKYQNEESVKTLSAVCINVFVLSLNGITEAFVQIVASKKTYKQVNIGYFISSLLYIILIKFFIAEFGTSGLVLAGSVSMIIRILTSCYIIFKVFDNFENYEKLKEINKLKNYEKIGNIQINERNVYKTREDLIALFFQISTRFILSSLIIWCVLFVSSYRFFYSSKNVKNILEHMFVGSVGFLSLCGVLISILSKSNQEKIFRFIPYLKNKNI
jgi:hypothetical protein